MIYLDNNATTAIDPIVLKAMQDTYALGPLNPSAIHQQGKRGKEIILSMRDAIATYFKMHSNEIYFTSSSTEALSTLIRGFVKVKGVPRILSTKIEHNAIDSLLKNLIIEGVPVDYIPIDASGAPKLTDLITTIHPSTELVILSSVYSETGTMPDLEAIAQYLYEKKIPLLVDATAHIGKAPFVVYKGISAFCASAHKFHGPQGIGLMVARSNFPFSPLLVGGHQEMHKRAGTENVAGIVGLAKALELIKPTHFEQMRSLKEQLKEHLIPFGMINGQGKTISNTLNIAFENFDAESLMIRLDQKGVFASMGSACSSGSIEPSRILLEMGLSRIIARSSLRFSLSRMTTAEEIERAALLIKEELCGCAL
ncbi:MAG: cysteine desulfurase family protein [Chlamydiia bacterium]